MESVRRLFGPVTLGVLASWAVLAVLCAAIPLVRDLGFERAFVASLWTAVAAPVLGAGLVWAARSSAGERGDSGPSSHRSPAPGWLPLFGIGLLVHALGSSFSIAAGALVEWWSASCDQQTGLVFFLLLPGAGGVLGVALGMLLFARFGPWWPLAMVVLAGLDLGSVLAHLYREPQVFAFSPLFGWWPGSLYDEALTPTAALWAQRSAVALTGLGLACFGAWWKGGGERAMDAPPARSWMVGTLSATFLVAASIIWAKGESFGFRTSRRTIESNLPIRVETDHFTIFLPKDTPDGLVQSVVLDHEFHHQRLTRWFGHTPTEKIRSYVYPSPEVKGRLLGARRTMIARPWVREIHIHGVRDWHPTLGHELAHVFAADWADGPLKVPAANLIWVNLGLIEGVAEATELPSGNLSTHQAAKALIDMSLAPRMADILSPSGFWGQASRRAYTVAGSFVLWLRDTHGSDSLAIAYRTNSFAHYDGGLSELEGAWRNWLSQVIQLEPHQQRAAAHRYRRPSIFQRTCPHVTANLREQAREMMNRGQLVRAEHFLDRAYGYHPDPSSHLSLAFRYQQAHRLDRAQAILDKIQTATVADRAPLSDLEAMLAWKKGDTTRARSLFGRGLELWTSFPRLRLRTARIWALSRPKPVSQELLRYLGAELQGEAALWTLVQLDGRGADPLVDYLLGRRLIGLGEVESARGRLDPLTQLEGMPEPLRWETELMLGRLAASQGDYDRAERHFGKLDAVEVPFEARAEARSWRLRIDFMERWPADGFDVKTAPR
ncbi:MAG: hypothetical protein ACFB9M_18365 [Myxococcota bacterium]